MIITRFAPSPTGYLHVGGARTALFCWLLARHKGGKMILRIEDTDQKRNTPTAAQQVMKDLLWLGIDWDEGPNANDPTGSGKGENGPYLQSQRREIYQEYANKLIKEGKAYYCFETLEELQVMREKAIAEKKTFIYPRPEIFPDAEAVAKARAEGRPVAVRFVVPELESIVVEDVVRGQVRFPASEISDFIIMKSDGFPTYHFGCVVDDELMGVTHVIRGQEHLMNTPNHQLLQEALGFRTPVYAHMSVTVSEGGGKLSKREPAKSLLKKIKDKESNINLDDIAKATKINIDDINSFIEGKSTLDTPQIDAIANQINIKLPEINVVDFMRSGYLPEAMVNFIALLGWSPGNQQEIMSREELIEAFDVKRLNKTNSLFDRQKLIAFNTEHMRMVEPGKLLEYFKNYLAINESALAKLDDEKLSHILQANKGAQTFEQIAYKCNFLYIDQIKFDLLAVKKVLKKPGAAELLAQTRNELFNLQEWDKESLHKVIEQLCQKHEVGMGKIAQPLRVAVTGTTISPPIDDSLILLGKEKTIQRIDATLEMLKD